jgi:hypothetical protein
MVTMGSFPESFAYSLPLAGFTNFKGGLYIAMPELCVLQERVIGEAEFSGPIEATFEKIPSHSSMLKETGGLEAVNENLTLRHSSLRGRVTASPPFFI